MAPIWFPQSNAPCKPCDKTIMRGGERLQVFSFHSRDVGGVLGWFVCVCGGLKHSSVKSLKNLLGLGIVLMQCTGIRGGGD